MCKYAVTQKQPADEAPNDYGENAPENSMPDKSYTQRQARDDIR